MHVMTFSNDRQSLVRTPPTIPGADNSSSRVIVPSDWQLASRKYYRACVWEPARKLHDDIGSYAGWIRVYNVIDERDGDFFFADGRAWKPAFMTEVFPDVTNKWMANFLAAGPGGTAPRAYSPMLERVRCVEVCVRLMNEFLDQQKGQ
jgi:hypothetical protein